HCRRRTSCERAQDTNERRVCGGTPALRSRLRHQGVPLRRAARFQGPVGGPVGVALEATEFLTSWTRTLNEEDALTLLDSAHPGARVEEWVELGHQLLPQASLARRRELIRIVREELLDTRDGVIDASAWLRLLQGGSPHRRLGLLYG